MVFYLYLSLHYPLSRLVRPLYLAAQCGGSVGLDKISRQLQGRFIGIVFCPISVPSDVVLFQIHYAAVPEDSVNSVLRGILVIWVCRGSIPILSFPLQSCLGLTRTVV